MIVNTSTSHLRLFFTLRGSIVTEVAPQIIGMAAWSGLVVVWNQWMPDQCPSFNGAALSLVGIALSIFVGSRSTICYERWWEGRRQVGALVSHARQFARETSLIGGVDDAERKRLIDLTVSYAHALVPHLRSGGSDAKAVARLSLSDREAYAASRNPPDALLRLINEDLSRLCRAGRIGEISLQTMVRTVSDMSMVQAACERLRSTPIPLPYRLMLYRTTYVFLLLLPFGYVASHAWAVPIISGLLAYAFFGLDALADQLERPFAVHSNGLPIETLADTIEINLRESLGETGLPPLPVAKDGLLF